MRTALLSLLPALLSGAVACASPARPSPRPPAPAAPPATFAPFFYALSVADVDRSAAWYRRTLGFELARETDLPDRHIRVRILRGPHALLELVELPDARPLDQLLPDVARASVHGIFKVGFRVADLDATLRHLDDLGVPLRGQVITEPDGTMRSAQIEDPDGNIIQLFQLLTDEPRAPSP